MFDDLKHDLNPARDTARALLAQQGGIKMLSTSHLRSFLGNVGGLAGYIAEDPEILFFAALQWLTIAFAYLLWTKALGWIPDSLWAEVEKSSSRNDSGAFDLINLFLLAWSFLIVLVASYPIGIANGAIVAVRSLREKGQNSTILRCLQLATQHVGRMWAFTAADAWITVSTILDRLPKKHNHHSALDELLYYAWKIGTIGVVPALVNGRTLLAAGKESILVLKNQPVEAIGIRLGYSLVCWVVGILAYVGAIYFYGMHRSEIGGTHELYKFYLLMGVPIFIAVGVVSVLVRPFYLLLITDLYVDALALSPEVPPASDDVIEQNLYSWHFVTFVLLLLTVIITYCFADQLGITHWINHLADKDILQYRRMHRVR